MKTSSLSRSLATLAVAALLAFPAAAQQADFTTFVTMGDSLTAGFTDGCLVDYAQRDSWGAIVARAAGATFEQPIIKSPGLGPCTYLQRLLLTSSGAVPVFGTRPNTGVPTNATLARPYNNLGVPGFTIHDLVTKNPTTPAGGLTYLILRGLGTQLQQAAALKPTFVVIDIGNNDVLGAAYYATALEGVTLTPMASIVPDLDQIFTTMKAAQGGTGKGIVATLPDVTSIPLVTTVSPILGINPSTGNPIYALTDEDCPGSAPVCQVTPGSYLTLLSSSYLAQGYGIPCAILSPSDPRQANCNKPLPGSLKINPSTGAITPGVVLTPAEVEKIRKRTAEINYQIVTKGQAAGYKVFDINGFFADVVAHGRNYGVLQVSTAFLTGGFFGYDGTHPSSLGYAITADEIIQLINAAYGNNLPRPDMSPFLFNGNTSSGGYPSGGALSAEEQLLWAAGIFHPDTFQELVQYSLPEVSARRSMPGNPHGTPVSPNRETPRSGEDRVH